MNEEELKEQYKREHGSLRGFKKWYDSVNKEDEIMVETPDGSYLNIVYKPKVQGGPDGGWCIRMIKVENNFITSVTDSETVPVDVILNQIRTVFYRKTRDV